MSTRNLILLTVLSGVIGFFSTIYSRSNETIVVSSLLSVKKINGYNYVLTETNTKYHPVSYIKYMDIFSPRIHFNEPASSIYFGINNDGVTYALVFEGKGIQYSIF